METINIELTPDHLESMDRLHSMLVEHDEWQDRANVINHFCEHYVSASDDERPHGGRWVMAQLAVLMLSQVLERLDAGETISGPLHAMCYDLTLSEALAGKVRAWTEAESGRRAHINQLAHRGGDIGLVAEVAGELRPPFGSA